MATQLAAHLDPVAGIECSQRFVEQQELRLGSERPRQRNPLRLTTGQLVGSRPFDAVAAHLCAASAGPPRCAADLSTPRARSPNATFSSTDMCGNSRYCWNITPRRPLLGRHEDARRRIVEDLAEDARSSHDRSPAVQRGNEGWWSCPRRWDRAGRRPLQARRRATRRGSANHGRPRCGHAMSRGASPPPNHLSRSATRTAKETATINSASTIACCGSVSSVRYTDSGSVCVLPGKLPANVMVAPNSPNARAHDSTAPATAPSESPAA